MQMPHFSLPEGAIIGGRYKLLKTLGQGGFGITYIAWDKELDRRVAVKECFPTRLCMRDAESGELSPMLPELEAPYFAMLEDMHREARTLAKLEHESVVKVYDVIWGNGSVFCIMQWLPGGTLRSRMAADSLPSTEESLQWLRCLLDALAYLHTNGIVHRDLKPENIMFDAMGHPVVIDFGAALNRPERTTGAITTQGAFSQGYASPEQITGKGRIGPWTDFYALSATWYELITGTRPEKADARLMQDDVVPLTEVGERRLDYPRELLDLLQRNLSLRIDERCCSVSQWLECWSTGTLPPLEVPTPPRRWHLRRWLLAAGVCALLAGGGYVLLQVQRLSNTPPIRKQPDPAVLGAELRDKLMKYYRVAEYVAHCKKVLADLSEMKAREKAERAKFLQDYERRVMNSTKSSQVEQLISSFSSEFNRRSSRWHKITTARMEQFYDSISPYNLSSPESMVSRYKPANMDEAALLASVVGAIYDEVVYPAYNETQLAYAKASANESSFVNAQMAAMDRFINFARELKEKEFK